MLLEGFVSGDAMRSICDTLWGHFEFHVVLTEMLNSSECCRMPNV